MLQHHGGGAGGGNTAPSRRHRIVPSRGPGLARVQPLPQTHFLVGQKLLVAVTWERSLL